MRGSGREGGSGREEGGGGNEGEKDGSHKWAATSIIASREETTEEGASLGQLCLQQDHSYLSGDSN